MKRIMIIIISILFMCAVLPVSAEQEEIVFSELPEYGSYLGIEFTKELEDRVVTALLNCEDTVDVRDFKIPSSQISAMIYGILRVHPEIFYVKNYISWGIDFNGVTKVRFTLTHTENEILQMRKEIDKAVDEYMEYLDLDRMTQLEIVLALHDVMISTMGYATGEVISDHVHDIYGALVEKRPVCQGYAEAFMYMMQLLDIPCAFVSSEASIHAWNAVQLNGKWYHIDLTTDDPLDDVPGRAVHDYFLITTETLLEKKPSCSDYTVETPLGITYTEADDTSFENGQLWNSTDTLMAYHDQNWYYIENRQLIKGNLDTQQKTVLMTLDSGWNKERCFGSGDSLYISTEQKIIRYDLITGDIETVIEDDEILGVGRQGDLLAYKKEVHTEDERYYGTFTTNIHLNHQWETNLSSLDKIVEKCMNCVEMKTKTVSDITAFRLSGKTRYETSYKIADLLKGELNVKQLDAIIVASGSNFADALAGSYLAAMKNAPILMYNSKRVNELQYYIQKNLKPQGTIYLLGGTGAVGEDEVVGLNDYTVVRLSGKTRYETNLAILNEAGIGSKDVLICTGTTFADSLSASATGLPILLVGKNLRTDQIEFLENVKGTLYVIGGTAAVSSEIEEQLKGIGTVKRVFGKSRYQTSIKIAETFFDSADVAVLAYGHNFPDGLCGGPLAFALKSPMILTKTSSESDAKEYVARMKIERGVVLGGSGLVSDRSVKQILGLNEYQILLKR